MQDDNRLNDPMNKLQEELNFQQPSEKPANDVLNAENSGADAESHFVHDTQEELNRLEEHPAVNQPASDNTQTNTDSSMPTTERLTEND